MSKYFYYNSHNSICIGKILNNSDLDIRNDKMLMFKIVVLSGNNPFIQAEYDDINLTGVNSWNYRRMDFFECDDDELDDIILNKFIPEAL